MRTIKNEYREKQNFEQVVEADILEKSAQHSTHTEMPPETPKTAVGCLRYVVFGSIGVMLSVTGAIALWVKFGFVTGLCGGVVLFILCASGIIYLSENVKQLTLLDCLLPIPAGLISATLFTPWALALNGSFFSAVTCMGAAIFLSMALLLYRAKKIGIGWVIVPFLVFMYELLPVEFPTDLDNILSFGANAANFSMALGANFKRLLGLGQNKTDHYLE